MSADPPSDLFSLASGLVLPSFRAAPRTAQLRADHVHWHAMPERGRYEAPVFPRKHPDWVVAPHLRRRGTAGREYLVNRRSPMADLSHGFSCMYYNQYAQIPGKAQHIITNVQIPGCVLDGLFVFAITSFCMSPSVDPFARQHKIMPHPLARSLLGRLARRLWGPFHTSRMALHDSDCTLHN